MIYPYAVFRRRLIPGTCKFGPRHYLAHVLSRSTLDAVKDARDQFPLIRSGDYVFAYPDGGEKRKYGTGAPSPAGVGLL